MECASAQHVVQFYGDNNRSLAASVSRYLAEGLKQGDGILVIAALERIESFMRLLRLQVPYGDAVRTGQLVCLDAQTTLAQILVDGQPHWDRFESVIGGAIQTVCQRTGHARLRAYGEMVDVLWQAGQPDAARCLEGYWNKLLAVSTDYRLFCAYSIDIFSRDFEPKIVAPILAAHTRLLSVGEALEFAVDWAVDEVLGSRVKAFEQDAEHADWATMPKSVATILWLKDKFPDEADQVLRRARYYYEL